MRGIGYDRRGINLPFAAKELPMRSHLPASPEPATHDPPSTASETAAVAVETVPEDAADPETRTPPAMRDLFMVWVRIGAFSFGGGASTLFMMRREFVQTRRWMTGAEYNKAFALSKLVPGTNIIAQSLLMGKMVAGFRGAAVSVTGMMLPAVLVTSVMAAFITQVQHNHIAQAMLSGVVPAAGGLTFAIVVQMIGRSEVKGAKEIARTFLIMGVCAALYGLFRLPVPLVLVAAGATGALFPKFVGVPTDAPPTAAEAVASAAVPEPEPIPMPEGEVRR